MHHFVKVRCRAIILHDEKLLVVDHGHKDSFYALPGGHLDPGETPVRCIKREIEEELGIVPDIGRLLYVYSFVDKAGVQSIEFFFEVRNGTDFLMFEERERTHAHEIASVRWLSREDDARVLPPEILAEFKQGTLRSDTVRFIEGTALDK